VIGLDLKVPAYSEKFKASYENLHPFTKDFITKYNLDDKIFTPRTQ
jgi:hypothetical protein